MKKFLTALLISLSSVSAFAATDALGKPVFDFTFFGNTAGRFTMVSCDYATDLARDWMTKFGARDLDLQCTGGIQPYGTITPLNLRVAYTPTNVTAPNPTHQETITIESGGFPGESNCDFDTMLMRAMLRDFANVRMNHQSDACFDPQSRYRYDLTVTIGQ